jgi:hypothetical protein
MGADIAALAILGVVTLGLWLYIALDTYRSHIAEQAKRYQSAIDAAQEALPCMLCKRHTHSTLEHVRIPFTELEHRDHLP